MKTAWLIVFFAFIALLGWSQDTLKRGCYMHEATEINKHKFPTQGSFIPRSSQKFDNLNYIIIPTVVHIIHDGGPENISDARVISQIERLNMDFGHYGSYNVDDRGEDTRIRFCLAQVDPDGNPTNGIVRVQSPHTNLDITNEMVTKNLSRWDQKRYLNIWVVKDIYDSETNNIQAYAYQPSVSQGPIFNGDGVAIIYKYFGKLENPTFIYDLGRTLTHEIGHYFDLLHPWGRDGEGYGKCDDDDKIEDTPVCSVEYFSVYAKCDKPTQCGHERMIENFMDYSTDRCMALFTPGQAKVMRNAIEKYRSILVEYENVINKGCLNWWDSLNCNKKVEVYPNPVTLSNKKLKFDIPCKEPYDLQIFIHDMMGRFVMEKTFYDVSDEEIELDLITLRPGLYYVVGYYESLRFQRKIILGNILDL